MTLVEAVEADDLPFVLCAVAVNVYEVPVTKPCTLQELARFGFQTTILQRLVTPDTVGDAVTR
jgi:hypothetical protein